MKAHKNEVVEYTPPREISELALKRAKDIYRQWAWNPSNTIERLIISIYLQGMNDAIDVSSSY